MLNKYQRMIAELPHDVYKAYSTTGALLYVGISVNVFKRMREHSQYAAWLPATDRLDVVQYANRNAARAEEARCIREDSPAFNITKERAFGCDLPTEFIESFTMRRDGRAWYIDGEG